MSVERQHILVQQQLHLAHRVVDEGGLELALPDDDDLLNYVKLTIKCKRYVPL